MSSHDEGQPKIVIVKNVKKVIHKHHGGSWKIAYADFVTAMMTFFLLMWLLSLLNKYQLQGIANYFKKPLNQVFKENDNQKLDGAAGAERSGPVNFKNEKTGHEADTKNPGIEINDPKKHSSNQIGTETVSDKSPRAELEKMKASMEKDLNSDPRMSEYKNQLTITVTADGLKIELKDLANKSMFSEGKTDFEKYAENILAWLSEKMNVYPNRVMIIGHTDNLAYAPNNKYSNWELSADRANATRRALIKYGMDAQKIFRVVGVADADLLYPNNPSNAANRRIEIIILTKEAAERMNNL